MLKRRILQLALAVITVAGSAGGLALAESGTAFAAPQAAAQPATQAQMPAAAPQVAPAIDTYTCYGTPGTTSRYCYAHVYCGAILYKRTGGTIHLNCNEKVKITCWYYSSGVYWDHVTWTADHGSVVGHVNDDYVNFGGHRPGESPISLHTC
jgi:hypothetical protein